jgi:hypothetical protein
VSVKSVAAAVLAFAAVASVPAHAQDDLGSRIVNDPSAPAVNGGKASLRDDSAVQGGKALRVQVPRKGANVWDTAVESALTKPVKAGDELVLAFSARLAKGDSGAATATIPFAGVQLGSAPYTTVASQAVEIGPEWKMVEIRGKAAEDYAAGALKVAIHLGTAKQAVDLGPIVVLDLGPSRQ